jgi:hypothetical protein
MNLSYEPTSNNVIDRTTDFCSVTITPENIEQVLVTMAYTDCNLQPVTYQDATLPHGGLPVVGGVGVNDGFLCGMVVGLALALGVALIMHMRVTK